MEVEVREEASSGRASTRSSITPLLSINTPTYPVADAPVVVVRVEEVLLVVLVLIIWVAAIALFFNRWGKIRMLEPYQPKFHQQPHRPSCPLAPLSPPGVTNQARMSFSKYNVNALTDPLSALPSPIIRRPRQNSVFVGSSTIAMLNPPPRRVKSAIDIQHLVVNEHSPTTSFAGNRKGSVIPMLPRADRRPSLITIDRPLYRPHRPSITIDRPLLPHLHHLHRNRRSSCFVERPRHKNFLSFSFEPQTVRNEKPSCSYHPTISFETPMESMEEAAAAAAAATVCTGAKPKLSRSFEQPRRERQRSERMATSLDVSSSSSSFGNRRCSEEDEVEEEDEEEEEKVGRNDRSSPIYINLDETKITAPLLEGLKSSDV